MNTRARQPRNKKSTNQPTTCTVASGKPSIYKSILPGILPAFQRIQPASAVNQCSTPERCVGVTSNHTPGVRTGERSPQSIEVMKTSNDRIYDTGNIFKFYMGSYFPKGVIMGI